MLQIIINIVPASGSRDYLMGRDITTLSGSDDTTTLQDHFKITILIIEFIISIVPASGSRDYLIGLHVIP